MGQLHRLQSDGVQVEGPRRLGALACAATQEVIVVSAHRCSPSAGYGKARCRRTRDHRRLARRTASSRLAAGGGGVVEGHMGPNVRKPEGPFPEFTGSASERSTQHSLSDHRAGHFRRAHQPARGTPGGSIVAHSAPAVSQCHRLCLSEVQNLRLHAYIAMRRPPPCQAKNAAVALGDDLSLT